VPLVDEAIAVLSRYLRINTSNPPGNEIRGARFWKEIFDREGIESEILLPSPTSRRANFVARIPGSRKEDGIVLLNHIDVVPADARRWRHAPFGGEVAGGALWGRGASDMKGLAVAQAFVLIDLRRRGIVPDRDLIFLATADEESGKESGAAWVLENRPDAIRECSWLLTEGAPARRALSGRPVSFPVVVTEKSPLWLRISAFGGSGHAAIPDRDSAPDRLIRALARLGDFHPDAAVLKAARRHFAQLADREPEPVGPLFRDLDAALANPLFRQRLEVDPVLSAMLHSTCQVTRLEAGDRINVIPSEATADVDCRLLPGESPQVFLSRLRIVAGDPDLEWEVLTSYTANESPIDTALFRAIERAVASHAPGARVETPILTASNDAHLFRDAAFVAYGFDPFPLSEDEDRAHAEDERMPLESFRIGFELYRELVTGFVTSVGASTGNPRGAPVGGAVGR
jgi:acetylornithine deacetylase/succinyl-diaminopimelate desuccinylase-like protein